MKVVNECSFGVKIYFDGDYIGRVESKKSRTWSVPSGSHHFKASSSSARDHERNITFYPGETTVVTLSTTKSDEIVIAVEIPEPGFLIKRR